MEKTPKMEKAETLLKELDNVQIDALHTRPFVSALKATLKDVEEGRSDGIDVLLLPMLQTVIRHEIEESYANREFSDHHKATREERKEFLSIAKQNKKNAEVMSNVIEELVSGDVRLVNLSNSSLGPSAEKQFWTEKT